MAVRYRSSPLYTGYRVYVGPRCSLFFVDWCRSRLLCASVPGYASLIYYTDVARFSHPRLIYRACALHAALLFPHYVVDLMYCTYIGYLLITFPFARDLPF